MKIDRKHLSNFTGDKSVKRFKKISSWRDSFKVRLSTNELIRIDFLNKKDKTTEYQKLMLENGLTCVPEIINVFDAGSKSVKVSEWIDGELFTTLHEQNALNDDMFFLLGKQMGKMNCILDSKGRSLHNDDITYNNVVWSDRPVIIDMDRTYFEPYPNNSLVKILLKRIIKAEFMSAFLEGYGEYCDIMKLTDLCESRNWTWKR